MPTSTIIDPNIAANAYGNTAGLGRNMPSSNVQNVGGNSFGDYLKDKIEDSVETIRASEVMGAKALTGDADLTQVVQATTAAEVTLNTIVNLRDRMISAYQEIMRMSI